jgi:hypothetical protein
VVLSINAMCVEVFKSNELFPNLCDFRCMSNGVDCPDRIYDINDFKKTSDISNTVI